MSPSKAYLELYFAYAWCNKSVSCTLILSLNFKIVSVVDEKFSIFEEEHKVIGDKNLQISVGFCRYLYVVVR
jgi:hypothetical protein